ncbi:phenylalanine--tRNA ligase subunit beta [Domibacillus sp. DTU_2020_1001157_1_SI_ALB_TIR_016]|uniref:phenylalanine--tRNA ligase subunit beta n=1 Tax=Domibacillus sp. DTU_2020_1001157_1_SI_ALB_TIR_016 TaxID=3077789 RepID=UPI0028E652BA|nr:phenylalanine--tRNA ligase subunit beta [Domibacillus sp. DTU_2020_1001157_1_SI_ALB_TIR_016]WNS81767.1 phenylalanine--tRNA ligase subunit beta [Domibacillus sp. DTU_2020_1001157_1_SI_ALB_TIR_016]
MFVSYKWLSQYVDIADQTPEELAEKITRAGIEVEGVEMPASEMKGIVVGYVQSREQHPNADKLSKCLVDVGEEEPVQIICGAKNVDAGQFVAVARTGAVLPGNFKIKRAKLRGEESNGMICSLSELGIESRLNPKEYAEGIFNFPNDVTPGEDALAALNRDDAILELSLTPNRSDALSMIGVAYEVAAILGRDVKLPEPKPAEADEKASDAVRIQIDAPEDNPLYIARVVKNVKIGPSPLWMQTLLMNAGIRPHNNVVDITNYVLMEYGQPLHAFDLNRVETGEIVVRHAEEGETFTTLDDVERTLSADQLVITNGQKPIALAGVMGGANSEVTEQTVNVLIESAYFNGQTVRAASKAHGLRSEASARFEKGVDPARVQAACDRAAELMAELAEGTVLSGSVVAGEYAPEPKQVSITLDRLNTRLGTSLTMETVEEIFSRLKFQTETNGDTITVTVPTRRADITIPEDLTEEVARLYGYDHIPLTLPEGEALPGALSPYQLGRRTVRRYLEGAGFNQAVTYSLTSQKRAAQFALEVREPVALAMPMSEERAYLRESLLPHLIEAAAYNNARQMGSVALYETGSVYLNEGENVQPKEEERLAGIVTGLWQEHLWQGEKTAVDFFAVKGVIEGIADRLGLTDRLSFQKAAPEGFHPGRTAAVLLDEQPVGVIGQLHPSLAKEVDIKEAYLFELKLDVLLNTERSALAYTPIPRFPSISRDIALVVDSATEAASLEAVIKEAGGALLTNVHVFDVYEGDRMEAGKKSVAFALTYMNPEKTLTDEEVTAVHEKVLTALKEKANADLRA